MADRKHIILNSHPAKGGPQPPAIHWGADNAKALITQLVRSKPSTAKGTYLRSITVSSTMGPGIKIDTGQFVSGTEEG